MHDNFECPICKSKDIVKLTNENSIYGLVQIKAPSTVDLNTLLPVHALCCKNCGHIELIHIDPKAISIKN